MLKIIEVAIGIIQKNDLVLIAQRPQHVYQGGLWEFPGGKIEPHESPYEALCRELHEELGITVCCATELSSNIHHYQDRSIQLFTWKIEKFSGIAYGKENQAIKWVKINELKQYTFPEASYAIIEQWL